MRKITFLFFALTVFSIFVGTYFYTSHQPNDSCALTNGFDTMSRQAQILVCASCHKEIHENELRGPHSRAYKGVMELSDYVNNDNYECGFYKNHVNNTKQNICITCHATDNMFETILNDSFKIKHTSKLPVARKNEAGLITGVDCLTCHYDGKKVVGTSKKFQTNKSKFGPIFNAKLASNDGCKPCHFSNWVSNEKTYFGEISNEVSCLSCHQQYTPAGKPTHYIYNRFRESDSTYNKLIEAFFMPEKIEKTTLGLRVRWQNRAMPHKLSEGPENIIKVSVYTNDNKLVSKGSIYLNQKAAHDEAMLKIYNNQRLPGVLGYNPIYNSLIVDTIFPYTTKEKSFGKLRVEVEGLNKGQYWFNDSISHNRFSKTIYLN